MMFPYDPTILAALQTTPQSIDDVIAILQAIQAVCEDGDGLKWFNRASSSRSPRPSRRGFGPRRLYQPKLDRSP